MRTVIALFLLALAASPVDAQGKRKPCEELKAEIEVRLKERGVQAYTLTIVPNEAVKPGEQVVGSCDGGTQKITYRRGEAPVGK